MADSDETTDPTSNEPSETLDNGNQVFVTNKNREDSLRDFREQWQQELNDSPKHKTDSLSNIKRRVDNMCLNEEGNSESEAGALFLKGIELEKCGKLYEAIQSYRRAIQLVPDIEFKFHNWTMSSQRHQPEIAEDDDISEHSNEESSDDSSDDEVSSDNLIGHVQRKVAKTGFLFLQQNIDQPLHLSKLPIEIITYILKWVVSSELDLRSLEMVSQVCRGFYLCARNPELWRLACIRVWGINCGPSPGAFLSWRNMFIERVRLQFSGCYISKTTYIRHGENSFQDQFYRPWHLVAYYRYLRFFPDGVVLMLTSTDEPMVGVSRLKYKSVKQPVLSGYYKLKDDTAILVINRPDEQTKDFKKTKRKDNYNIPGKVFRLEFQILSTNKKKHVQLKWIHYSILTRSAKGEETTANFDVNNQFPPLWFSRVKSYTSESHNALL